MEKSYVDMMRDKLIAEFTETNKKFNDDIGLPISEEMSRVLAEQAADQYIASRNIQREMSKHEASSIEAIAAINADGFISADILDRFAKLETSVETWEKLAGTDKRPPTSQDILRFKITQLSDEELLNEAQNCILSGESKFPYIALREEINFRRLTQPLLPKFALIPQSDCCSGSAIKVKTTEGHVETLCTASEPATEVDKISLISLITVREPVDKIPNRVMFVMNVNGEQRHATYYLRDNLPAGVQEFVEVLDRIKDDDVRRDFYAQISKVINSAIDNFVKENVEGANTIYDISFPGSGFKMSGEVSTIRIDRTLVDLEDAVKDIST